MSEEKKNCPVCDKYLCLIEENKVDSSSKVKLKIWCKRCKREVTIEI